MARYVARQVGAKNSLDYRVFTCRIADDGSSTVVSPFHDIPLRPAGAEGAVFNMVVEVPRFTNAKLEIAKDEPFNPIKQDVKKGALRYVHNCFPFHGYLWNYGAIPQTWESPSHADKDTGIGGDNDPIDVLDIGSAIATVGQVKQVKVLGALAMIDDGETDWKIIAIDVNDPLAASLNDIADVEVHCPGLLAMTRTWFTNYKIPDGKAPNVFAFDGEAKDRAYTLDLVASVHLMWQALVNGTGAQSDAAVHAIAVENATLPDSPAFVADQERIASKLSFVEDASGDLAMPEAVHKWSFVPLAAKQQ